MDKKTIRLLEGIGYVAAVIIAAGALLERMVQNLQWVGVMLLGIVLTTMIAVTATSCATEIGPSAPEEPETSAEEKPEDQ